MNESVAVVNNIDISIWGLILQADLVVRIVMLLLLILSIFCWAIIFEKVSKYLEYFRIFKIFINIKKI